MGDYDYPEFDGYHQEPPTEPPSPEPAAFKPWRDIWLQPRVTIRRLVEFDPAYMVILLGALAGISEALDRASSRNQGDHMGLAAIIMVALVFGSLGGVLSLWIGSHLMAWTGRWLEGTAPPEHLRTAMAWSSLPSVVVLGLTVVEIMIYGRELFTTMTPRLDSSALLSGLLFMLGMIELVLGVWSLVLLAKTVAEVQGYRSAWRGLGNVVLAGLVILVPILLLVIFFAILGLVF